MFTHMIDIPNGDKIMHRHKAHNMYFNLHEDPKVKQAHLYAQFCLNVPRISAGQTDIHSD